MDSFTEPTRPPMFTHVSSNYYDNVVDGHFMVYDEDGNYILKPLLTLPVVDNNSEPIIIPKGELIVSKEGFLIDRDQGGGKKSLRKNV